MDYHSKDIAWIKAPRKVEAKPEPEPKPAEAKPEETVKANYHFAEMKKAILDKKPASLESLLKKGADINGRDDDGFTPLMWAAASGNEECTKLLIKKHAPLESKDKQGSTALLNAAGMGAVMTVKMLLDKGADMAARDEKEFTALHKAARNGHPTVCKLLVDHYKFDVDARDNEDGTPLIFAAYKGHNDVVETLMARKANVNAAGSRSNSALMLAVTGNHLSTVTLLLEHGADLNSKTLDNENVLDKAKSKEMRQLLLDSGAMEEKATAPAPSPPQGGQEGPQGTHSAVPRPALSDAVGYGVEVDSHEPDALEGDAFPATIHAVNVRRTVTVCTRWTTGAA